MSDRIRAKRGFSLLELLIVISILAILSVLGFSASQKLQAQTRAAKCASNLKQCGLAMMVYVAEHNGVHKNWMAGSTTYAAYWTSDLLFRSKVKYTNKQLEDLRCKDADCAPDINGQPNLGSHYGLYVEDPYGKRSVPETGTTIYTISYITHPNPGSAPFMGDSLSQPENTQRHTIRNGSAASRGGFHARHNGRANVFFVDGHLEAATPKRLQEVGITAMIDEKNDLITAPFK